MFKEKYFCGLDIGSRRLKAVLLEIKDKNSHPEVVASYSHKTYGFERASVSDLVELSESIHSTISHLSKKAGMKVKTVNLGLPADAVEHRDIETVIPLIDKGSKIISQRDEKRVNEQAKLLGIKMEEDILHDLPQHYVVDDINTAFNPLGLYGRKLAVKSLMILSDINRIRNLSKAVNQSGYDVSHIFFSSFSASHIVLSDLQKQKGCVLIDIGSRMTSVLVFKNHRLMFLDRIHVGGDDFTEAITHQLGLAFNLADDIKRSCGASTKSEEIREEEILIKKDNAYIPIKKDIIFSALEPKIEQVVKGLHMALRMSGLVDQLSQGIVFIGGGSLLSGLIERIGKELNMSVRLGKVTLETKKEIPQELIFLSSMGVALNAAHVYYKRGFEKVRQKGFLKMIGNGIHTLYQEYF